ncbi:MAG TPA: TetR family transcriptional regulator, partial [Streptosporangiaceae bacterium]
AKLTAKQRQSQATRQKLLAAARAEFSEHGLAGGRVDRIGERAGVNKRLIYVYFGDKEGLFEEVIRRNRDAVGASVRFDAEDLPGYALRLYDYWQEHPDSVRLFWWRNLERPRSTDVEDLAYGRMVGEIGVAQAAGQVAAAIPAAHVFAFVLGLLQSWAVPSPALSVTTDADEQARRRASVRTAVERLIATGPAG